MYLISRFILHSAVLRFCTVAFTVISNTGADYLDPGKNFLASQERNGLIPSKAVVPGLVHMISDPLYGGNCKCHSIRKTLSFGRREEINAL
jgi:hypothetical protein